jgi:hypothetical protein
MGKFNLNKQPRCEKCGHFVKRGIWNWIKHWETHIEVVKMKTEITKEDVECMINNLNKMPMPSYSFMGIIGNKIYYQEHNKK